MVYYILGSIALIYFIKTQLKIKESKISKYNAPIKNLPKNTDAKKGGWRRK